MANRPDIFAKLRLMPGQLRAVSERHPNPERQRLVWEVADRALGKSDLMKIGMIITMAPNELPAE